MLHPELDALITGWDLTPIQAAAIAHGAAGHALLAAPTGHGKTEAALLPVLARILHERDHLRAKARPWPRGFKVLYITPLRALNRDLLDRLQGWAATLGLRIGVRHGDTTQAERSRQSRDPPDILITTPETVQLLLFGDTLRRHLATVRFVILDEVHELARSERGAQLMAALERIEEVIAEPEALRNTKAPERLCPKAPQARPGGGFVRIGLSATVSEPDMVAAWMVGQGRHAEILQAGGAKRIELTVDHARPTDVDRATAARLALPEEAAAQLRLVREIVAGHPKVLVFTNARDTAELLVSRSALLDQEQDRPPLLELHHGSLSPEHRRDVEHRFKQGDLRGLVATSSLELGIDVGAITHVVQVQSPKSVDRLVQRVGRAGHRADATARGTLVAAGSEDALECMAVARRAMEGRLEPFRIPQAPLSVLANQLVALVVEYKDLQPRWAREVLLRAAPLADAADLFDAVWDALVDVRTLREERGVMTRSGRARRHFLDHVSMIPDERIYRIVDEATKRSVGTVDDAFVATALEPGAAFIMAGRSWKVLEVDPETARVRVAQSRDLAAVPQWSGQALWVSASVAHETLSMRVRILAGDLPAATPAAHAVARAPLLAQKEQGLEVPDHETVCIEPGRRRTTLHVGLGTRGNETLGRILQALLHQRTGTAVAMESDAYRIHLQAEPRGLPEAIQATLAGLDPEGLDVLLMLVLRGSPALRHHAVHVAKHFGALPKDLDPNRTTQARLDAILAHTALQEEALRRLMDERLDVDAVAGFLSRWPTMRVVVQTPGPIAAASQQGWQALVVPRRDDTLLAAVRRRIEESDALLLCTQCRHTWQSQVHLLPRTLRCRRCRSNQVACLRPWNEEARVLLGKKAPTPAEALEQRRVLRNAATVASFGSTAARALVGRGVGPDTAARILQKSADPEEPAFWRSILEAELEFARTNAYWRKR